MLAIVALDRSQELDANYRARLLKSAVEKHYLENGRFPAALPMVADYLEEGKKGLSSPWGLPYQYTLGEEKENDGSLRVRVYVWTERVVGKEIRIYGTKPPARKN
jgi:hypothetical protein